MAHDLTLSQLEGALPKGFKHNASQDLVDKINSLVSDPLIREAYRDNLLSYLTVMEKGRFQIGNYIDAVRYITHKLMGNSDLQAYIKTFPDRYEDFVNRGVESKDIASYVSSYNKNKLVNLIREQTIIPTHVLNADIHQRAVNTQAELMMNAKSEMVRMQAANSLLIHLKVPEATEVKLDVSVKTDNVIKDLRQTTLDLVSEQKKMIQAGISSPKDVAESDISVIEGEVDDD